MTPAEEDALIEKCLLEWKSSDKQLPFPRVLRIAIRTAVAQERERQENTKLWLWKNFVDGKQEYWAFDNLYPIHLHNDDPQTLGEPCGYAIFKPSRAAAIRRGTE